MPSSLDRTAAKELLALEGLLTAHDAQLWRCHTRVDRYEGDILTIPGVEGEAFVAPKEPLKTQVFQKITPYDVEEIEGNLLVIGGASVQWQTLIGNGTTTAGQALTYYNNAQAAIGVGNSATAAADTQTNLQGAVAGTDRFRVAMDATYPLHTDTTGTAGSKSIVFRSTFATGTANITWNEWGIFNSVTDGTGRMLNRKQEALGTKTSSATWVLTITLSLA